MYEKPNLKNESVSYSVMSDSLWPWWTIICQAPLSMRFSRQEYWNGFPFFSSENLPNSGITPESLTMQADSLPSEPAGIITCNLQTNIAWKNYDLNSDNPQPRQNEYIFLQLMKICVCVIYYIMIHFHMLSVSFSIYTTIFYCQWCRLTKDVCCHF